MNDRDRDERLLASPLPQFDTSQALARLRTRVERERIRPSAPWSTALAARVSFISAGWTRTAIAAVAVVLIATTAALTGVAQTVLTVFEPKQVATIQVDPRQLGSIPDPSAYGTITWIAQPAWRNASDASAAAAAAGFTPLAPASLPATIPAPARYSTTAEAKATFQFDEAKARAAAAKVNATIPPMPASIAQTTLTMVGGPAIMTQYGSAPSAPPDQTALGGNPTLVVVQAKAPVVTSNGATVNELRDYALAQPGIPPSVAAQVRAIGDPVATMLLPIGVDLQNAKQVTVRGTTGYLIGDGTGLGSGVVWLERGYVIGVMGTLKESELISLVNGLR